MRLLGITIEDFRSIHDQWLPTDGLVVLFGPNSAGKTSVLEAAVELLRAASNPRVDPGARGDVFAVGSVQFTLPDAEISASPDAELYRALLTGEHVRGKAWEWLAPEAADLLRGKAADDAREWIASRLVESGQVGLQHDREILARAVLDPAVAFFVADFEGVLMRVAASHVSDDVIEAAHRIAADTDSDDDLLREIAVRLTTERAAAIGSVADFEKLADAFPPVIVLDGAPASLSADLRTSMPVIHDRLWDLHYPHEPGHGQLVDVFQIGIPQGVADYYRVDTWLEQMSDSGKPEIRGLFDAYGQGADWYRVRHSILAIAAVIEEEANRVAPSFLRSQGEIGVEVLPVSVWGPEDHRVRVTFTGRDGERRDLRVVGAGTARWAAAAVQLACRRLEKGRQVVTDRAGAVIDDVAAARDLMQEARAEPLNQTTVRLEPLNTPGVYVVDEPEAHLHPAAIASVRTWLEELAQTMTTTVLAASHSPILLNTSSHQAKRVLVLPRHDRTELRPVAGTLDDNLSEAADELGITKGDLLLMTRLVVFVEGPHDAIILSEWFGNELRDAGIRVFPAHGGDNFQELVTTKPGLVGSEVIAALGIRMAVVSDKSPTRVEPAVKRLLREAKKAGVEVVTVELSEDDILFYLDERVCRKYAPDFPGWHAARNAARRHRSAKNWKKWISEMYGLDLSLDNICRLAAECKGQGYAPSELSQKIRQLANLAAIPRTETNANRH
jgi:AAA domain, putative AbiEii toxin, Type IV TA system